MTDCFASLEQRFQLVARLYNIAGRELLLRHPRSVDELIDEVEFAADERLPYWAMVWPSASVLAERIASENGEGRTLLELGCGIGLVSLAAARAGFQVLATDYQSEALEFTRTNAHANGIHGVTTQLLDWRFAPADMGAFDVVCAADVLYEKQLPELIARLLKQFLKPGGLAILTDPGRQTAQSLPACCLGYNLKCERVAKVATADGATKLSVDLYEARHQAA